MISGPLHAVNGSLFGHMKTLQRWTDQVCTLDMCNTARSFTHESTTYVIRRLAFLNLDFIDPLSCTPLPSNLLSHHFWVGYKVLTQSQTQEVLKCRKSSVRFSALPSVCAQRRACATIPRVTLFSYNPEMFSAFSAILSDILECKN